MGSVIKNSTFPIFILRNEWPPKSAIEYMSVKI
ncbi:hypothetical protein ES705_13218 [subsurface metagenome]